MELYQAILKQQLGDSPALSEDTILRIVELQCYQALRKIREILDDDTLEDKECFDRIEEIVCLYEAMGSDGGSRHDFS